MTEITLRECQQLGDEWGNTLDVRYFSELTNLAQLVEEVGEVASILSRRYDAQGMDPLEKESDLVDEFADGLYGLCCLTNQDQD